MIPRSRRMTARSFAGKFLALEKEGAGNAGRPMRPQPGRAEKQAMPVVTVTTVTPENPAFPAQWFYGFLRALPGDRAFLPPSSAKVACRTLDTSVGVSGPHDFAVRLLHV